MGMRLCVMCEMFELQQLPLVGYIPASVRALRVRGRELEEHARAHQTLRQLLSALSVAAGVEAVERLLQLARDCFGLQLVRADRLRVCACLRGGEVKAGRRRTCSAREG